LVSRDTSSRAEGDPRVPLLPYIVLVEVAMDSFVDLHGCPTKVTSNVNEVGLQVRSDAAAMARLYLD
jgi:hypothetical protein